MTQVAKAEAAREEPYSEKFQVKCWADYFSRLNGELKRDPKLRWLLVHIETFDRHDTRPVGGSDFDWLDWRTREKARALIEEREPWPELLRPYKSRLESRYRSGRAALPPWLDPQNWTEKQRALARAEAAAHAEFLAARDSRLFDSDRDEWTRRVEGAIAEVEALQGRRKRLTQTVRASVSLPSLADMRRGMTPGRRA